jgi:predicted DNA-binding WGR domain protein
MTISLTSLAAEPRLVLQAIDPARNIRRGYTITRAPDLFGWHIVSWSWGRIDGRPRLRARAFRDEAEAIAFARQLLARRATAPRRIGVAYRPVGPRASPSRPADQAQPGA